MKIKVYTIISLFALIITFGGVSVLNSNAISPWFVGDVNRDGMVDGSDASLILRAYGELGAGRTTDIPEKAADVNHDGAIDGIDASIVLRMYADASAEKYLNYEVIVEEDSNIEPQVLTKTDEKGFDKNDLVKFTGVSWFLHADPSFNDGNLYPEKNFIVTDNIIAIVERLGNWYSCIIDCTLKNAYVYIGDNSLEYFEKVGKYTIEDTTTATTVTTTTTTTTTTSTTSTTTTTSSSTTSTTSTTTTTSSSTTSTTSTTTTTTSTTSSTSTTTTTANATYSNWQCVEFVGSSWNVRSTPEFSNNVIGYLYKDDIFFIKKYMGNEWYEICRSNTKESQYIRIENEAAFKKVTSKTYMFVGTSWNVRSTKDLSDNSNVVCQLNNGDIIATTNIYEDGWAKILTNKSSNKNLYVVLDPFKSLYT